MRTLATASTTIGLVLVGPAVLMWLTSHAQQRRRIDIAIAAERFRKRIESPDLDGLERRLGHPLSASLRALYADRDLVMSEDVLIAVPNPLGRSKTSYIAWFEPADAEALDNPSPGCEGLFAFANNGAGDQFFVDPKQADPEVLYYLHETGKKASLGVRLSAFMAAPRGPVRDD